MYFYFPFLTCQSLITKEYSEHLFSCRVRVKDRITLSDLQGSYSLVEILDVNKKTGQIRFTALERNFVDREEFYKQYFNHNEAKVLIQAIIDKAYLEQLFEILPHTGFAQVYLWQSDFSPLQNPNQDRLNKILTRSLGQSQSLWRPSITFLDNSQGKKIIEQLRPLWLNADSKNKTEASAVSLTLNLKSNQDTNSILIGPEGGFSIDEKIWFETLGLNKQNLGSIVYPAWLAGLVAIRELP